MALLSDTDPDPTPPSTLCCDSAVEAYKHSDPEKTGKKERREMKDRARSGFIINTFELAGKQIPTCLDLFPHLDLC